MHTNDQIRAHTIGELKPLDGQIPLADYDPQWPALFRRERDRIQAALGDRALQIEHTGSTSIPGLIAKPIIDITLAVADSRDEAAYVSALEAAGYVLRIREPDWYEHRMFRTPEKDVHVHIYSDDCPEIQRYLTFRDRLRRNSDDRSRYELTKRRLAMEDWPDMNAY